MVGKVGYLYAVYAVAKVTVYTAMTSCVLQGYMWLHSQVGHTYNSRVDIRSAEECACGTLPVRTMFIHACSLYENVVNETNVAWYKVVNTTKLEIWQVPKMG